MIITFKCQNANRIITILTDKGLLPQIYGVGFTNGYLRINSFDRLYGRESEIIDMLSELDVSYSMYRGS